MRRLYVICRADLDAVYAAVQGGHAIGRFKEMYPDAWKHDDYLIFLEVENEHELIKWGRKCPTEIAPFCEPDLDGQLTAFATVSTGEYFRGLDVLGTSKRRKEAVDETHAREIL